MLKTVYTKTIIDIDFYEWSEDYLDYVETTYGDKKIFRYSTLSDDGLVRTDVVCWTSKEDYLTFWEDPYLTKWFNEGVRYRIMNEIQTLRIYKDISIEDFEKYLTGELND
jgi:hypothetical protein